MLYNIIEDRQVRREFFGNSGVTILIFFRPRCSNPDAGSDLPLAHLEYRPVSWQSEMSQEKTPIHFEYRVPGLRRKSRPSYSELFLFFATLGIVGVVLDSGHGIFVCVLDDPVNSKVVL